LSHGIPPALAGAWVFHREDWPDEAGEGLQCHVSLLTVEARPDGWRAAASRVTSSGRMLAHGRLCYFLTEAVGGGSADVYSVPRGA